MSQARTAFAAYRSATEATVSKQRIVQMLLDGAVLAVDTRPPALGQHTEPVLAALATLATSSEVQP